MSFWKWNRTAASNALGDPTCPWPEGMDPAQINDSARGMMAAAAKYRDDIAGAILTGGNPQAYTVASFEGYDSLANLNGMMIAFTPHATNGAAVVTLNVDGLGAKPLRSSPNAELPSGTLIQGTPYVATYNNSDGAFYLQGGLGNPYNCPLGGAMLYTGPTAPNSAFVFPSGQAISRTTYASYFSLVGTTFGPGDGSTTFNILDLRGTVPAGVDNMNGSSGGLMPGLNLGTFMGASTHALTPAEIPSHTHSGNTGIESTTHTHPFQQLNINNGSTSAVAVLVPIGTGGGAPASGTESANHTHPFTTDGGPGSGAAHSIVQPTRGVNYILRII